MAEIVSVPLTIDQTLRLGRPQVLFEMPVVAAQWDVSADGQRFIALQPPAREASGGQVNVVLNWSEELKRLVPAR
jgi:hypothetical protein